MVITINETNFQLYRNFLSEAYQYLDKKGLIRSVDKNDEGTFTSIAQYFNYIEDIKESDKSDYFLLKLPLDENALEINGNTRTISTASFSKGAIVQRDKVAETVIFTIDRFIDNMDLCNVDGIFVQWTAPDGNGGVKEWATKVEIIDFLSIPGKIKFGWPIDDEVTKYPGKVQFSVTFFVLNPDSSKVNDVIYRLNTLPASFDVKPALQPEINRASTVNQPGALLKAAIKKNRFANKETLYADTPDFDTPGLNLPKTALLINDELTLKAQAVTTDTGIIDYEWYFTPEGSSFNYKCGLSGQKINFEPFSNVLVDGKKVLRELAEVDYDLLTTSEQSKFVKIENSNNYKLKTTPSSDAQILLTHKTIGTVSTKYEAVSSTANISPRERLYVQLEPNVFTPVTDSTDEDLTRYEKYSILELPEEYSKSQIKEIVGEYRVKATNTVGAGDSLDSAYSTSETCILYGPESVEILTHPTEGEDAIVTKDTVTKFLETEVNYGPNDRLPQETYDLLLDEHKELFTSADGGKYKLKDTSTTKRTYVKQKLKELSFTIKSKDNTSFAYVWKKSSDNELTETSSFSNEPNSNLNKYTVKTPGWYKANISANKNRKLVSEDTKICRVVSSPEAPELSVVLHDNTSVDKELRTTEGIWNDEGLETEFYMINANKGDTVTLSVDAAININGVNKAESKLYSDGIKYEWRRLEVNPSQASQEEILNTEKHGTYLPYDKNPSFKNKEAKDTFSNHPGVIKYEFDGQAVYLTCYAINTLADRTTEKELEALRFYIT